MLVTIDTTHPSDKIEFEILTPKGFGKPISGWVFIWIHILESLVMAIKFTTALVPAVFYIWIMVAYWPELKAEGLRLWEAGTGLVALYGLGLHWWRTSTQDKLYEVELKKAYSENRPK